MAAWIKVVVALVPMMVGTLAALAWSNSHTLALLSREYGRRHLRGRAAAPKRGTCWSKLSDSWLPM